MYCGIDASGLGMVTVLLLCIWVPVGKQQELGTILGDEEKTNHLGHFNTNPKDTSKITVFIYFWNFNLMLDDDCKWLCIDIQALDFVAVEVVIYWRFLLCFLI